MYVSSINVLFLKLFVIWDKLKKTLTRWLGWVVFALIEFNKLRLLIVLDALIRIEGGNLRRPL